MERYDFRKIMYNLLEDLKNNGFTIHFNQSFKENSCSIRLDYGLSGAIRLSDREEQDKFKHTFNYITCLDKSYSNNYCLNDYKLLLDVIKQYRKNRQKQYGFKYFELMLERTKESEKRQGFWKNCREFK